MQAFLNLGLREDLVKGLADLGFTTPTPIQDLVIPAALKENTDVIALAQTGTGKTAAFGLPLLQKIVPDDNHLQGLILCPTRELCVQVAHDLENYSKHARQFKVVAVYGGASIENQKAQIRKGAHIVVATPGRLVDLITRRFINLDHVNNVVLDEADEMLNMGFRDDLDTILDAVPNRESIWLFSATMPSEVRSIARTYMSKPVELAVNTVQKTNENIEHEYYAVRADDRYAALKRIVDANPGIYGIIFCRTKADTKDIAEQMIRDGYNSDALHGDLAQADRDRVMQRFREKNLQLLVATDVAARGIDVNNVSHVINYGLPDEIDVYQHRSGRTGRAGKTGISLTIITSKQEFIIRQLEQKLRIQFKKKNVPTGSEVCEKQLMHIVKSIHEQQVNEEAISPFMDKIYAELADISKEELIKRFASVEFNRFLAYYSKAEDLQGNNRQGNRSGMQRYFVNIGELDDISRKEFKRMLTDDINIPAKAIGDIDLNKAYLHFDIEQAYANEVKSALEAMKFNGRRVRVDEANARKEGGSSGSRDGGGGYKKRTFGGGGSSERSSSSSYNRESSGGGDRKRYGGGGSDRAASRPSYDKKRKERV